MDISKFNFDFEKIMPLVVEEATKLIQKDIDNSDMSNSDLTQNLQKIVDICVKHSAITTTIALGFYHSSLMDFLKDV